MSYKISALMFILWGMLAAVTMIVELENDQSAVGGSTQNFESLANTVANPDQVGLSDVTLGDDTSVIGGTWDFIKQGKDWVLFMGRSLMLQSPIWEGWTQPVRWAIMLISIPYMLHVIVVMMSAATNMIGGISRIIPGL